MLSNKEQPYVDKLQIIQLIEADVNATMKMPLSRQLMRHANNAGVNISQTHIGKQGRSTYAVMNTSQLSTDITRRKIRNLLIIFNDADGCYDMMRPNKLCFIVLHRVGFPSMVASYHS